MNDTIKTDPLVFDKLISPLQPLLGELDQKPVSQAAEKLRFAVFVRLLLFRLFGQVRSLRDLVLDLKTKPDAQKVALPVVGLSTIHDAFGRYPVAWFSELAYYLAASLVLAPIGELRTLGLIWCVDSSYWPLIRQVSWLSRQGLEGVRLHMGLSLNTFCPAQFIMSLDKSPSQSERRALLDMAVAGITYVLDRGYVHIGLYWQLIDRAAYFVIRERNNLCYRRLAQIPVMIPAGYHFLGAVSDSVVRLRRDESGVIYRLVHFVVAGHEFHLLTNRFDLTTFQIIQLYAWRWQVELLFRAWKHTLQGLHLINLSEAGIEIQFNVLLIGAMLWVAFQQTAVGAAAPRPQTPPAAAARAAPSPARTPTALLGQVFRVAWRWLRPVLRLLCNCLTQPFSVYVTYLAELRL